MLPLHTTVSQPCVCAGTAELVVRELEKDAVQSATEQAEKDDMQTGPVTRYMMRSVACFQQQGVAFVDTQLCPAWQALHCNLALSNVSLMATLAHQLCSCAAPEAAGLNCSLQFSSMLNPVDPV